MAQYTALGGDIFAGLFTYGVRKAGFKILGHLEHTTYGTATARLNFPKLDIRNGVHSWNPAEFTGKVDFMYTNPPCAAWSAMQVTSDWTEHTERLQIIRDLVDAGLIIQPRAWCWESVLGAWRRGREFVLEQAERWLTYGYHVTVLLQNNMHLGTSQNRPRMFLIAHRHPLVWAKFETPLTLNELFDTIPDDLPPTPVNQPPLAKSLKQLWKESLPYNGTLRRALILKSEAEQAKLRPRPAMTVQRMRGKDVPGTFIGASKRLHPTKARTLDWYECLALAGLPWDWQTCHRSLEPASLELSRAVMPAVGTWLGRSIKNGFRHKPLPVNAPVCRLVDLRKPDDIYEEVLMTYAPPKSPPKVVWAPEAPPATKPGKPRPSGQPRKPGSGARIRELLEQGLGTDEILKIIHHEFPDSKAGPADVSWNRRKLKQLRGEI